METPPLEKTESPQPSPATEVAQPTPSAEPAPKRAVFVRPPMYAKQLAAIWAKVRYAIIEASTKSGKTWGCIAWLLEKALAGKRGQNFWWVAPVFGQSKIAYRRLKRALPPALFTANETELTLTLANGTVIWFKSGETPDNLYGEDVFAAVVDEATRLREESWVALRTTLTATHADCRIIGNKKGRKNWAWKMARRAESGTKDMAYARLTAWDAADGLAELKRLGKIPANAHVITREEIEDARAQMPAEAFKQLYEVEDSDDEGNPFGIAAIRACIGPLSAAKPVVTGRDLAKSVDWTVGVALDRAGCVCKFERFQIPWTETKQRIAAFCGNTPTLVDSTGVGDPVLEDLQRVPGGNFTGYLFTSGSKQKLMEGLAIAIQQRKIRFPSGPIAAELEAFEYEYTRTGVRYSAPEGMHDDCVCALALAVQLYQGEGLGQPMAFETVRQRGALDRSEMGRFSIVE